MLLKGQWDYGDIQREINKCFIVLVEERLKHILFSLIERNMRQGSVIISKVSLTYILTYMDL